MTTQLALACCPPSALSAVRLDRTRPQRDASRKMREGSLTSRRPAKAPAGRRPRPRQQSAVSKTSSSTLKAQASCGLRLAGSRPVGPISRLATEEGARLGDAQRLNSLVGTPWAARFHSLGGPLLTESSPLASPSPPRCWQRHHRGGNCHRSSQPALAAYGALLSQQGGYCFNWRTRSCAA